MTTQLALTSIAYILLVNPHIKEVLRGENELKMKANDTNRCKANFIVMLYILGKL